MVALQPGEEESLNEATEQREPCRAFGLIFTRPMKFTLSSSDYKDARPVLASACEY